MTTVDFGFLKPYIEDKNKRHQFYKESVKEYNDLNVHMDGLPPNELLRDRRPAESEQILKYREKIYAPITKVPMHKVMNSLLKIRTSPDWSIKYDIKEIPAGIPEEETLENYMEFEYPKFSSFTNWFFSVAFKNYLVDSNSILLLMPLNINVAENEYYKPFPTVFNSEYIIDYEENSFYVLLSKETCEYKDGNGRSRRGFIYYIVTDTFIYQYNQIKTDKTYAEVMKFPHGLGELPIVKLNGYVYDAYATTCLYGSRIDPMLPSLNEAAREYSDLQAEIVQHIHSTIIAYQQQQCNKCKGSGFVPVQEGAPIECSACAGNGYMAFDPYSHIIIRPQQAGEQPYPTKIAEYLVKPIDIAKLQDERIKNHIYDALSAINFEFLAETPLNQSGKAKEVDRSELNNFVFTIAEDVVRIFDECYDITNDYRYGGQYQDEELDASLPVIAVPQNFDIASEEMILLELSKAKQYKLDPIIISNLIIEYSNKKFNADEEIKDLVVEVISLDPFASMNEDDILIQKQNDGFEQYQYVIHCNITTFVNRAMEENPEFESWDKADKQALMKTYATEVSKSITAKNAVMAMLPGGLPATPKNAAILPPKTGVTPTVAQPEKKAIPLQKQTA